MTSNTAGTTSSPPTLPRTQCYKGSGLAIVRSQGQEPRCQATFTHLRFSFPLKLICPRTSSHQATEYLRQNDASFSSAVAALYIVGYGGGLVSGDDVSIDIDVGSHCTLLILTQGSTKVFKVRGGGPHPPTCRQMMRFLIRPSSTLLLLPDPVTCYAQSRYTQTQRFDVTCRRTSSLVVLDWITPGRQARGEKWDFKSYRSRNEVRVQGAVLLKDVVDLEEERGATLSQRMAPYGVYASLFLVGPATRGTVAALRREWTTQRQRGTPSSAATPPDILWGLSVLREGVEAEESPAIVVRIAGHDTDAVRAWLRDRLGDEIGGQRVGWDLWRTAMGAKDL